MGYCSEATVLFGPVISAKDIIKAYQDSKDFKRDPSVETKKWNSKLEDELNEFINSVIKKECIDNAATANASDTTTTAATAAAATATSVSDVEEGDYENEINGNKYYRPKFIKWYSEARDNSIEIDNVVLVVELDRIPTCKVWGRSGYTLQWDSMPLQKLTTLLQNPEIKSSLITFFDKLSLKLENYPTQIVLYHKCD